MNSVEDNLSDAVIERVVPQMCSTGIVMFAREYLRLDESDIDRAKNEVNNNAYEYLYQGLLAWSKAHTTATVQKLLEICERQLSGRAGSNQHVIMLREYEESSVTQSLLSRVARKVDPNLATPLLMELGTETAASALKPQSSMSLEQITKNLLLEWKKKQLKEATITSLREAVKQSRDDGAAPFDSHKVVEILNEEEIKHQKQIIRELMGIVQALTLDAEKRDTEVKKQLQVAEEERITFGKQLETLTENVEKRDTEVDKQFKVVAEEMVTLKKQLETLTEEKNKQKSDAQMFKVKAEKRDMAINRQLKELLESADETTLWVSSDESESSDDASLGESSMVDPGETRRVTGNSQVRWSGSLSSLAVGRTLQGPASWKAVGTNADTPVLGSFNLYPA